MKWILYTIVAVAIGIGWILFMKSGDSEREAKLAEIERIENEGSIEELETVPTMRDEIETMEGSNSLTGVLLAFLTAGLVGVVVVIDVLPTIAHKFTHAVYDSAEEVDEDPMHDARSKMAQGDWDGAIAALKDAAAQDSMNRLPYVEIAKIQREQLNDSQAAVNTLREAIEGQEWEQNNAAFLMFRLAEIYEQDLHDHASAGAAMRQVIEQFPETRHSANARHKLQEWGLA